ncbi:MAG: archaeal heat shock protein Hsp20 [Dehalococcoidia bacterium]
MSKKEKNDKVNVDFGMGQISFGGLFKGLGNLIDLASKLSEEGYEKRGDIRGLPNGAKGVYGFSIKTLAGKPVIESFGNIRETARGPVVEEVREPMVDVFDEKDHILVIAELPGVSESEIKIEVAGDILNLAASDRNRKYAREVLLPGKVKPDSVKTAYKNGILEITLEKEK